MRIDGAVRALDEEIALDKKNKHDIELVVDRLVIKAPESAPKGSSEPALLDKRLTDSVETALREGKGVLHALTA